MILVENIKKKISTEFVTYLKQQYMTPLLAAKKEKVKSEKVFFLCWIEA